MAAAWSICAKLGSLAVTLISIPLAIETLGVERFGIWIAVTTFFSILGVLDGGIGNAVINMIADQRAARNQNRLREITSSAYALLTIAGTVGIGLAVALSLCVDWTWAISLPATIPQLEVVYSSLIVGVLFFMNFPLSLAIRIRQGLQESHINSLFDMGSHLYILIGTTLCWYFQASLLAFLSVFASGPVVASFTNSALLWLRSDIEISPRMRLVSSRTAIAILSTGSLFLGLQICAAIAFQTDILIVSNLIGLDAAAELGLVNRVFLLASTLTGFFIIPLWPAFRDAASRGDADWIRRVFRKTLTFSLAASLATTIPLVLLHAPLIKAWTGTAVIPSNKLVVAVFLWSNILVVGNLLAALLNGLHVIRMQLILSAIMTLSNLAFSLALTTWIGTSGVVWGSIISYSLCILLPYTLLLPRIIREHTVALAKH